MKKITLLVGNPDTDSLSAHLAQKYIDAASAAGHEVRRMNIGDMQFDPILHKGYKVIQTLESDLVTFQENIRWADHFVLIYPLWWSGMPALLKGMFDRVWIPGFAFHFHKNGMTWDKLLRGKSARVITLSKTPPFAIHFMFGDHTNELLSAILGFAGFRTALTQFGNVEKITPSHLQKIETTVERLGRRGA